jgi:glycosyltransferase involved in cell wall biosynthesis
VRIVTAFSHGTCVVTHGANRQGIQELEHDANALVGESPEELVREALRALDDPVLRRRIGMCGRDTYDRDFRPDVSVGRIADVLDQIRPAPLRANAMR